MKNIFIILLLFIIQSYSNAQDCQSLGKNILNKIKSTDYKELIPYYDSKEKKWGLMNKKGEVLTKPLVESVFTFNINISNMYYLDNYCGCDIELNYRKKTFNAQKTQTLNEQSYSINGIENLTVEKFDINGFKVEDISEINLDNGKITGVTKAGNISKFSSRFKQVKNLFYFQDKWYAVATLKNNSQMGIIDENGEPFSQFDFNYYNLKMLDFYKGSNNDEIWFYYDDLSHNKGFINLEGKTILKGELLSECLFYKNIYTVQKNEEKSGVLDLRNLTWIIKPQKEIKIEHGIELGEYGDNNSDYYVIVYEGKEKYLVDLKLNKYKKVNKNKK